MLQCLDMIQKLFYNMLCINYNVRTLGPPTSRLTRVWFHQLVFYNISWGEAIWGSSGNQAQMFCTFYKDFITFMFFLDAQVAISFGFDKELLHYLQSWLFFIFSMFLQVSRLWWFLSRFVYQNAPELILATLGSFGPSGGISWSCSYCSGLRKLLIHISSKDL